MQHTVVVTGATGMIGRQLCRLLVEAGHQVRSLSRTAKPHPVAGVETFTWNPAQGQMNARALDGATAVVNLAGESLANGRWTDAQKRRILESRTQAATTLARYLNNGQAQHQVEAVVQASAIGYYAHTSRPTAEDGATGQDFQAQVCHAWEAAARGLAAPGRRLVVLRIGVVLSRDGGAFPELARPVRWGIGTHVGNGHQVLSWIHIRDLVSLIAYTLKTTSMQGVYNAVSQEPCSQRFFLKLIARYYHRLLLPFGVPSWALRLALGQKADIVLKGSPVISTRLTQAGFVLRFPHLYEALGELCRRRK